MTPLAAALDLRDRLGGRQGVRVQSGGSLSSARLAQMLSGGDPAS